MGVQRIRARDDKRERLESLRGMGDATPLPDRATPFVFWGMRAKSQNFLNRRKAASFQPLKARPRINTAEAQETPP